ncbi:MAG: hypothetical protein AAFQ34_03905 [Pseudomonadota bacterium]
MKTTWVRGAVDLFIGLFALAAIVQLVRLIASIVNGTFGTITWPVQAEAVGTKVELAGNATIRFPDGNLSVVGEPVAHALGTLASLTNLALVILALLTLRRVVSGFAQGEVLTNQNAAGLRKIAFLLLAVCAISVVHAFALQPMILSAIDAPSGVALHPSISWDIAGVSNVWLHYDPPLGTFLLAGLAFIFSAAIQSGARYRDDSESVV